MCDTTVKNNSMTPHGRKTDGFTLVEMAVVIVIIGLVIAAAGQLLQQRQKWLQTENTRLAVAQASDAITAFRNTYGRYPCPASLTATPDNPATAGLYGVEGNCSDVATVATGSGLDANLGYAAVAANRDITYDDRSTNPPTTITTNIGGGNPPRIRVGALPFKNLNMEEDDMYDGYRNRIIYAVSEQLAVSKTFEGEDGTISVLNDQNASIIQPADSAHFIILSTGENGAGGYTYGGLKLACANTSLESQNCDFETDPTYRFAQTGTQLNGAAATFDDVVSYASHEDIPLWEKNPSGAAKGSAQSTDVAMKTTGKLGIGATASKTPTEEIDVEGVVIARDDPGTPQQEGNLEVETLCDYSGGTTTCFPSSLIAGDLSNGDGMSCPAGQFMVGIKNGAPVCQNEVKIECPAGLIAIGINADGSLNCGAPPPASCVTANVLLCTVSKTLFAAPHGTKQTITISPPGNPGGSRSARYSCNNGSWVNEATWGDPCNCTPTANAPTTVSCKSWSACGTRWTGTKDIQSVYTCPSGTWSTTTLANNCVCDPTVRTRTKSCPSGYNGGNITQENRHDCAATPPKCTGWLTTANTCSCTPQTQTRKINCPSGLTGKIDQERFFTCPGGSSSPGSWGSWQNVGGKPDSFFCSCVPSSTIKNLSCPTAGYIGTYQVQEDFVCPSATYTTTVLTNTCAPPPPVTCQWTMTGTGGTTGSSALPIKDGKLCDCATELNKVKSCSKDLGGGSYKYSTCTCQ